MTKQITYTDLDRVLQELDAQMSASEVHGIISGMLCISSPKDSKVWKASLQDILACKPDATQWAIFTKLKNKIQSNLQQDVGALMLPDDEVALTTRLQSLADWVNGFLSGVALVGMSAEDLANPVVKELVDDLSQIAKLSPSTDASEEDEKNFAEIVEYVRIAMQNLYIELQSGQEHKILH